MRTWQRTMVLKNVYSIERAFESYKSHFFSVKNAVGRVAVIPRTEHKQTALRRDLHFCRTVMMAEHDIAHVGPRTAERDRKIGKSFFGAFALGLGNLGLRTVRAAAAAAPARKADGPARMDGAVEDAAQAVAEGFARDTHKCTQLPYSVAVAEKELDSADFADVAPGRRVDDSDAYFAAEIVVEPDVVVPGIPVYFHP